MYQKRNEQNVKVRKKEIQLSDEQRTKVYKLAQKVPQRTRDEICPAILNILLKSEKGPLKNELGKVIFHLQKQERLNTIIGLEKLLDGALKVAPQQLFELLERGDKSAERLAEEIKQIL
ncbi:MAG: hypothetical protein ACOC44_06365 [Promethearchaeia archaeon]